MKVPFHTWEEYEYLRLLTLFWGCLQSIYFPSSLFRLIINYFKLTHSLVASLMAAEYTLNDADWNKGGNSPRKSAPTRLNDNPKYIHWPRRESSRPPTPRFRSFSNVSRKWETWEEKWKNEWEWNESVKKNGRMNGNKMKVGRKISMILQSKIAEPHLLYDPTME